jgi:hypothetical protein
MTFDWSKAKLMRRPAEKPQPEPYVVRPRFDVPAGSTPVKVACGPSLWDFIEAYMPAARDRALSQPQSPVTETRQVVDSPSSLKL